MAQSLRNETEVGIAVSDLWNDHVGVGLCSGQNSPVVLSPALCCPTMQYPGNHSIFGFYYYCFGGIFQLFGVVLY